VLRGTSPADLPVEIAEAFLSINLETAEALGLDIPDKILQQADTIIRQDRSPDEGASQPVNLARKTVITQTAILRTEKPLSQSKAVESQEVTCDGRQ
jgi:hypothetical protein